MPREPNTQSTRRRFLRRAGAGSLGVTAALAGCTGADDGGGGSGDGGGESGDGGGESGSNGDSGGDGSGGGGDGDGESSGGVSSEQDLTTVRAGIPPLGPVVVTLDRIMNQTSLLEDEMEQAGYTMEVQQTWDEITLFAAGKVDFVPSLSDIEGTRFAIEREIEVAYHGIAYPNYEGYYVRSGSDLDPANTGSVEASIRKAVEENRPWGHAGWNQGSVWPNAFIMKKAFDLMWTPEETDMNVNSADWFALPRLLVDKEEVDIVVNAPILGMDEYLTQDDPPVKPLMWQQPWMEELGIRPDMLNLGLFGTTKEFSDQHSDAVAAYMRAWKKGLEWARDPANFEQIASQEKFQKALTADGPEEAMINLQFSMTPTETDLTENTVPVVQPDIELTEDWIETDKQVLDEMVELGLLKEGWEEFVTYRPISL